MLVLSRKEGEEILIGDSIVVRVVRVQGGRVKLGITSPADVKVMRAELVQGGSDEETQKTHESEHSN